ncbi:hypothetical protein FHG87_015545, partial [Trinorchestia longiramus]
PVERDGNLDELPDGTDASSCSRAERMHQLRAEHQLRHLQRNGAYPTDHDEDRHAGQAEKTKSSNAEDEETSPSVVSKDKEDGQATLLSPLSCRTQPVTCHLTLENLPLSPIEAPPMSAVVSREVDSLLLSSSFVQSPSFSRQWALPKSPLSAVQEVSVALANLTVAAAVRQTDAVVQRQLRSVSASAVGNTKSNRHSFHGSGLTKYPGVTDLDKCDESSFFRRLADLKQTSPSKSINRSFTICVPTDCGKEGYLFVEKNRRSVEDTRESLKNADFIFHEEKMLNNGHSAAPASPNINVDANEITGSGSRCNSGLLCRSCFRDERDSSRLTPPLQHWSLDGQCVSFITNPTTKNTVSHADDQLRGNIELNEMEFVKDTPHGKIMNAYIFNDVIYSRPVKKITAKICNGVDEKQPSLSFPHNASSTTGNVNVKNDIETVMVNRKNNKKDNPLLPRSSTTSYLSNSAATLEVSRTKHDSTLGIYEKPPSILLSAGSLNALFGDTSVAHKPPLPPRNKNSLSNTQNSASSCSYSSTSAASVYKHPPPPAHLRTDRPVHGRMVSSNASGGRSADSEGTMSDGSNHKASNAPQETVASNNHGANKLSNVFTSNSAIHSDGDPSCVHYGVFAPAKPDFDSSKVFLNKPSNVSTGKTSKVSNCDFGSILDPLDVLADSNELASVHKSNGMSRYQTPPPPVRIRNIVTKDDTTIRKTDNYTAREVAHRAISCYQVPPEPRPIEKLPVKIENNAENKPFGEEFGITKHENENDALLVKSNNLQPYNRRRSFSLSETFSSTKRRKTNKKNDRISRKDADENKENIPDIGTLDRQPSHHGFGGTLNGTFAFTFTKSLSCLKTDSKKDLDQPEHELRRDGTRIQEDGKKHEALTEIDNRQNEETFSRNQTANESVLSDFNNYENITNIFPESVNQFADQRCPAKDDDFNDHCQGSSHLTYPIFNNEADNFPRHYADFEQFRCHIQNPQCVVVGPRPGYSCSNSGQASGIIQPNNFSSTKQPLSSSSSNCSSSSGRSSSLPRMGIKGVAAAKLGTRSSSSNAPSGLGFYYGNTLPHGDYLPCATPHSAPRDYRGPRPAPLLPPKVLPNPLGALASTNILEENKFWRLAPVPAPPTEARSNPPEQFGLPAHRPGSRGTRGSTQSPAAAQSLQFAHYANYQQIQQHLRNEEQERLKQLASQQYRDFREKHYSRKNPKKPRPHTTYVPNECPQWHLLHKLEQSFIDEAIMNSRECREYQSQRGPREGHGSMSRPVSNYYEYESVQAMMTHATTSSGRQQQEQPARAAQHREDLPQSTPLQFNNSSVFAAQQQNNKMAYATHHQPNNNNTTNISIGSSNSSNASSSGASHHHHQQGNSSRVPLGPPFNNNSSINNNIGINNNAGVSNPSYSVQSHRNHGSGYGASAQFAGSNSSGNNRNNNNNSMTTIGNMPSNNTFSSITYDSNAMAVQGQNSLPRRSHGQHYHSSENSHLSSSNDDSLQYQANNAKNNLKQHQPPRRQKQAPPPPPASSLHHHHPLPPQQQQQYQAAPAYRVNNSPNKSGGHPQSGGQFYPPSQRSRQPPPPPPPGHALAPTHHRHPHHALSQRPNKQPQVPGSKV